MNERLSQAREAIPPGLGNPEMGPISTGLGDVFQFTVEGEGVSAMELRTILDWLIAPRLRAVPGVIEVNAWGGLPKQYQVVVDPSKLLAYGIALEDVFEAVEKSNAQRRRRLHRAQPRAVHPARRRPRRVARRHREDRAQAGEDGTPITVGSVAQVREGAMLRLGAATNDGQGETVIGIVLMLAGENARQVATRARQAVEELAAVPARGRPHRAVLRPRRARPSRHPHRRDEPARGGAARRGRALRLPRQPPGGADRGLGHPALDAVRLHRHGASPASPPTS